MSLNTRQVEDPRSYRRLQNLSAIGELLGSQGPREALPAVIAHVSMALPLDSAFFISQHDGQVETRAWYREGQGEARLEAAARNARENHAYLTGAPSIALADATDVRASARLLPPSNQPMPETPESHAGFILLPLVVRRSIVGILQLQCFRRLVEGDLLFVNAVARQLAFALERQIPPAPLPTEVSTEGVYRRLVDSLNQAFVWEADESMRAFTYVSGSGETLLGYPRAQWLNEPDFWRLHLHPEDRDLVEATLQRALTTTGEQRCIHRSVTADSRIRWFETVIHPVLATHSNRVLWGVSRDITDARRYEREHAATLARKNILAVISHDLRAPLGVILMSLSILTDEDERDATDPDFVRHSLGVMTRAGQRMLRLINSLLDAESAETGSLSIVAEPVEIGPVLEEAFASMQTLGESASLSLRIELPPALPPVLADADRVVQVLTNLVGNAIKFTPPGGIITFGAELAGSFIRFWVRDTGAGISATDLPQVFDRTWQSNATAHMGQGLGLFIVKAIIEGHQGRVSVESELGVGTTFSFTLPLATPGRE